MKFLYEPPIKESLVSPHYELIKNAYPEPCLILIREIFNLSYQLGAGISYELFVFCFRLICFILDFFIFSTLCFFCSHYAKKNHQARVIISGIIYIILGLILYPILYDRLDMVLLSLIFVSFLFFLYSRYFLALLMLVLSICFKLVPLLLSPLFIVSHYRLIPLTSDHSKKNIPSFFSSHFILNTLFFMILIAFFCTSLYFTVGKSAFDFLYFHQQRGLHIEAVLSSFILLLRYFHYPVTLMNGIGSIDISFHHSAFFVQLSGLLTISMIGAIHFYLYRFYRYAYSNLGQSKNLFTKGLLLSASIALLFTAAFIFSKVLSTQYFVWLIPFLAFMLPYLSWYHGLLWLLIFASTSLIFPVYFFSHIVPSEMGPNLWGMILLLCRNGCLIVVLYLMLRDFYCLLKPFKLDGDSLRKQ